MREVIVILFLTLTASVCYGSDKTQYLNMTCQDYSWSDVEVLVQPYLDDALYTSLVMQGQSADYKTSAAASQAIAEALAEVRRELIRRLIERERPIPRTWAY